MSKQVIICTLENQEDSEELNPRETNLIEFQLKDGENYKFGINETLESLKQLNIVPCENAIDLLLLASAVYCADTRISRAKESQDSWTREIEIHLPVANAELWNKISDKLAHALNFLTGDIWSLCFSQKCDEFSDILKANSVDSPEYSSVCLFSGGLDSFIGAIDLVEEGQKPLLVSHSSLDNISGHYQKICLSEIRLVYGEKCVENFKSRIGFPRGIFKGISPENTERSRSFLFFSLAALAASGLKNNSKIYVPENGLISLNIPLDPLRVGALSTRTTHPYLIARFNEILSELNIKTNIVNPYQYKTKGEMVRGCKNQELLAKNISNTMSCSSPNKARRAGQGLKHCGYCVPCIIRKACLSNWTYEDTSGYWVDIKERILRSNRPEGDHVRSFQYALAQLNDDYNKAKVLIHKSGPLNDYIDNLDEFAGVYLRGMREVKNILEGVVAKPYGR